MTPAWAEQAAARSVLAAAAPALLVEAEATAGSPVPVLRSAVAAATERLGRLSALQAVETTRAQALRDASLARDEQADALAQSTACELTLAVLPERRVEAARRLEAAHTAAAQVPVLRERREALVALRPDVLALARLEVTRRCCASRR